MFTKTFGCKQQPQLKWCLVVSKLMSGEMLFLVDSWLIYPTSGD